MPEHVYVDLTPGLDSIPASTWSATSAQGVMDVLVRNLREGVDPKGLSLREILSLQEPAHSLVSSGFFEPGGGFDVAAELLTVKDAIDFFITIRQDYMREAWVKGDEELQRAKEFFDELEGSEIVRGLYDALPKPKSGLRDRLLGRFAIST